MQKRLILLVIILLIITINQVYSLALFPNKDKNLISLNVINLKEVRYSNNITELVLESNSNYKIDGIIVNINNNDNIVVNEQLNSYETKIYTINTKEVPNTIEIRFFNDINHKRNIINQVITYRITGNEENIIQQPQQILIQQENQQLQQEFNNNPSYISYSSYSKLDDNKNIIYFTKDHISSNRISTNQQGNIEFQANYQPYGKIFKEEGQEQYKFSNKELDNSNLYYFGARYYDSSIGRFTQVDPIFKLQESPYMYANNNPLKYVDPTGEEPIGTVIASVDLIVHSRIGLEGLNLNFVVASTPDEILGAIHNSGGGLLIMDLHGSVDTMGGVSRDSVIEAMVQSGVTDVVDTSCQATCNVNKYAKAGINAIAQYRDTKPSGMEKMFAAMMGGSPFHGPKSGYSRRALEEFLKAKASGRQSGTIVSLPEYMLGPNGDLIRKLGNWREHQRNFRFVRAAKVGVLSGALSLALVQPSNAEELAGSMATTSIAFIPGMGPVLAGVFGLDPSNSYSQTERWKDENPSWIWQDEVSVSARAGYGRDEGRRW